MRARSAYLRRPHSQHAGPQPRSGGAALKPPAHHRRSQSWHRQAQQGHTSVTRRGGCGGRWPHHRGSSRSRSRPQRRQSVAIPRPVRQPHGRGAPDCTRVGPHDCRSGRRPRGTPARWYGCRLMSSRLLWRFALRDLPAVSSLLAIALLLTACRQRPDFDPAYHEFAYVTNGKSDSVSVIDTLALRNVKTIQVGKNPSGVTANPARNEIYVANTDSNNVSIVNAERNEVVATLGVHRAPYFVSVSTDG